ncbi:MAG: ATP-binding cassette domain-containing protein [Chloroflexi bacterium]|nr:ATP-binding cassette domain-containing protein [Chloroflexota bacterium]
MTAGGTDVEAAVDTAHGSTPASVGPPGPDVASASPGNGQPLVSIQELVKFYPIHGGILRRHVGDVRAVDGVSLDIPRGEILGLVGESGCGKSTLGKTVLRLLPATSGRVLLDGEDVLARTGRDLKRLRRRMQIVFQDPVSSLNPRMPVSDIIGEGLVAQADAENGWGKRSVRDKRVGDYLEVVGLRRDYARRFPHEFSGGQRQRIGIARALALEPEFLVCDEPVSALDVSIQSQILNLLLDLRREFGLTYLFVAHNLSVVQYISDRVGVMYLGKLVESAPVESLYEDPRHPYTVALLSAVPVADPRRRTRRLVLKGDVPSPAAPPSGCRFHPRCWLREQLGDPEQCETVDPPFRELASGHRVACHFAERISKGVLADAVAEQPDIPTSDVVEPDGQDLESPKPVDAVPG